MNKAEWTMKKMYYRMYQSMFHIALKVIKYPEQEVVTEKNGILRIPSILKANHKTHIFLACSKSVRKRGLLDEMLQKLESMGIAYTIFEDIHPNPTTQNVEEGYRVYLKNNCDAIVAIGGGSPLDCAKIVALRVANPKLSCQDMKKMSAIKKKGPYFVAVPTTAGTGSESTVAAVITDAERQEKYPIVSFFTMPDAVILDEELTMGLPKTITAYTGMDALTHAIEAYIGTYGTDYTNAEALQAIKMIFENLELAYADGENREARKNMLVASNHAANSFTRAYTGYVHTISHALSALYDVGHGKTNATVLPYTLQYFGKSIEDKLANIAVFTGIGTEKEEKSRLALRVIEKIITMNKNMEIPDKVEELQKKDIPLIVEKALRDGNPSCPVPKIMNEAEGMELVKKLLVSCEH